MVDRNGEHKCSNGFSCFGHGDGHNLGTVTATRRHLKIGFSAPSDLPESHKQKVFNFQKFIPEFFWLIWCRTSIGGKVCRSQWRRITYCKRVGVQL
jgi:hypothetical protein